MYPSICGDVRRRTSTSVNARWRSSTRVNGHWRASFSDVRWGPSYPENRGHTHHHPVFGLCLLWPNGWMDEDTNWYGSRPRPRPHCIRRGPSSAPNGHRAPPIFSVHVYCGHGRPTQLLLSSRTVCMTACVLKNLFSFDTTVEIICHLRLPICMQI